MSKFVMNLKRFLLSFVWLCWFGFAFFADSAPAIDCWLGSNNPMADCPCNSGTCNCSSDADEMCSIGYQAGESQTIPPLAASMVCMVVCVVMKSVVQMFTAGLGAVRILGRIVVLTVLRMARRVIQLGLKITANQNVVLL